MRVINTFETAQVGGASINEEASRLLHSAGQTLMSAGILVGTVATGAGIGHFLGHASGSVLNFSPSTIKEFGTPSELGQLIGGAMGFFTALNYLGIKPNLMFSW